MEFVTFMNRAGIMKIFRNRPEGRDGGPQLPARSRRAGMNRSCQVAGLVRHRAAGFFNQPLSLSARDGGHADSRDDRFADPRPGGPGRRASAPGALAQGRDEQILPGGGLGLHDAGPVPPGDCGIFS
jgi:hypothetical protein